MVVDDTLSLRIYSFIDNILIIKTIKEIKQKIDFTVFCARHLGLIVTAVTINGFTPVTLGYGLANSASRVGAMIAPQVVLLVRYHIILDK